MATIVPSRVSDILQNSPDLSTFNQLIRRSKLIAKIDTDEPYTIFAPTNDAFEKLPAHAVGALIADDERFRETMAFHVVEGEYPELALRMLDEVDTLAGVPLLIVKMDTDTIVGGATIVDADETAENGYVHCVDTVLFPG